jgi:lipoic acid synthetase
MTTETTPSLPAEATIASASYNPSEKQKGASKTSRIPIKIIPIEALKKPDWIRVRAASPSSRFYEIKDILRANKLVTVCEEASCPNIGECFGKGTATFMIMGDKCTRRCPFCDVGHGRPDPLDVNEPENLAKTIAALKLNYVVITSVDRDDLRDGGAGHFAECIRHVRALSPNTRIEILVPDFRGRMDRALEILNLAPPDVMNHNLETAPRLYKEARPGSDYQFSLNLLKKFKALHPNVPTKSGSSRKRPTRWASAMRRWARWCAAATTPTSRRGTSWLARRRSTERARDCAHSCPGRHGDRCDFR